MNPEPSATQWAVGAGRSHVRWWILALVFGGTTLNYLDRMVMGILAPGLQKEYAISDSQYGYIQSAFALSYAIGQVFSGRLLDQIGTRLGYALSLLAWSLAAVFHALAQGPWGFGVMRALLGVSESPAFPGAAKILAEWFPRRERAFAFGFVNAGTNMGVICASATVPWLATTYGWRWAFIGTGAIGFLVLLAWIPLYRNPGQHRSVSPTELAYIRSDPPEPVVRMRWLSLVGTRQAWAFAVGKFLTDSMWWFYMTWFPKYLNTTYQLDLIRIGLPLITIYVICDLGSVGGGWLSSFLIQRGRSVNIARKSAFLICALGVMPIMFAQQVRGVWPAVLLLGLVTAAHQGFSSNLYTIVSDMFPRHAVASVAGLGGMCGYFGASLFQIVVGYYVEKQHNYTVPFVCAGSAYLLAAAAIHGLAPRLEPAQLDAGSGSGARDGTGVV
ncbi:MAG: MFS transporter [Verrucomicrobiota bacterium]